MRGASGVRWVVLALLLWCWAAAAVAQAQTPAPARQQAGSADCAIVLDGRADEPCWATAPVYGDFSEYSPQSGRAPQVQTQYRLMHDADALYVFVESRDPQPDALRYAWSRRDRVGKDQDQVTLYIDPIGKRSFAQLFRTNPVGSVADGTYNEASGEESLDQDFDFSVATAQAEDGWSAEFRIPFSSLRYGERGQVDTWTLLVTRNRPREQRYLYTSVALSRYSDCFLCRNPELGGLTLPDAQAYVNVTPYVLTERHDRRSSGASDDRGNTTRAGVDVKARLGPSWFVDATVNPDFSQVEIDAPQLSANARFGIFYPEKRAFFLEGADLLDTPIPLVYTRSIADPKWGARVTRRSEGSDWLAIATRDSGDGAVLYPGTWSTVPLVRDVTAQALMARGRVRLGEQATWGATLSLRDAADDDRNAVVGSDLAWQVDARHKLRLQMAASDTRGDARARLEGPGDGDLGAGHALFADHSFYGEHTDTLLTLERISRNFRSENGFIAQAGHQRGELSVTERLGPLGWFTDLNPYVSVAQVRALDGGVVTQTLHPALLLLGPYATGLLVELHADRARADQGLALHRLPQVLLSLKTSPNATLTQLQLDAELGRRLDVATDQVGPGQRLLADLQLRLDRRTELSLHYNREQIDCRDCSGNARLLTDTTQQLVLGHSLSATSWLRLIVQRLRTERGESPGGSASDFKRSVLSLVLATRPWRKLDASIGISADRGRGSDSSGASDDRTVETFVKLSWPFAW